MEVSVQKEKVMMEIKNMKVKMTDRDFKQETGIDGTGSPVRKTMILFFIKNFWLFVKLCKGTLYGACSHIQWQISHKGTCLGTYFSYTQIQQNIFSLKPRNHSESRRRYIYDKFSKGGDGFESWSLFPPNPNKSSSLHHGTDSCTKATGVVWIAQKHLISPN